MFLKPAVGALRFVAQIFVLKVWGSRLSPGLKRLA